MKKLKFEILDESDFCEYGFIYSVMCQITSSETGAKCFVKYESCGDHFSSEIEFFDDYKNKKILGLSNSEKDIAVRLLSMYTIENFEIEYVKDKPTKYFSVTGFKQK